MTNTPWNAHHVETQRGRHTTMQGAETEHRDRRKGEMQGLKKPLKHFHLKQKKKQTKKQKYLITDNFQFINMHFRKLNKNFLIFYLRASRH